MTKFGTLKSVIEKCIMPHKNIHSLLKSFLQILATLVCLCDLNIASAQTKNTTKKTTLSEITQGVGDLASKLSNGAHQAGVTIKELDTVANLFKGNGQTGGVANMIAHPAFPECEIFPSSYNPVSCSAADSQEVMSRKINALTMNLGELGQSEKSSGNGVEMGKGPQCLENRRKSLELTFKKFQQDLSSQYTQMEDAQNKNLDLYEQNKKLVEADYNLLYNGAQSDFNAEQLLDPACQTMLEKSSLKDSFAKGGLDTVIRDHTDHINKGEELLSSYHDIKQEIKQVLKSTNDKFDNKRVQELFGKGARDEINQSINPGSEYDIKSSKAFKTVYNNTYEEYQNLYDSSKNKFQDLLGPASPENAALVKDVFEGEGRVNINNSITNWSNAKELRCMFAKMNVTNAKDFENALVNRTTTRSTIDKELLKNTVKAKYVQPQMKYFLYVEGVPELSADQSNVSYSSIGERIAQMEKKSSKNQLETYSFSQQDLAQSSSNKNINSLPGLLSELHAVCRNTSVGQNKLNDLVQAKILPYAKAVVSIKKDFQAKMLHDLEDRLLLCKDQSNAPKFQRCSKDNLMPSPTSSFCLNQALSCSQDIMTCSKKMNDLFKITDESMKAKAKINNSLVDANSKLIVEQQNTFVKAINAFMNPLQANLKHLAPVMDLTNLNLLKINPQNEKGFDKIPGGLKSMEGLTNTFKQNIKELISLVSKAQSDIDNNIEKEISAINSFYEKKISQCSAALSTCQKSLADEVKSQKSIRLGSAQLCNWIATSQVCDKTSKTQDLMNTIDTIALSDEVEQGGSKTKKLTKINNRVQSCLVNLEIETALGDSDADAICDWAGTTNDHTNTDSEKYLTEGGMGKSNIFETLRACCTTPTNPTPPSGACKDSADDNKKTAANSTARSLFRAALKSYYRKISEKDELDFTDCKDVLKDNSFIKGSKEEMKSSNSPAVKTNDD